MCEKGKQGSKVKRGQVRRKGEGGSEESRGGGSTRDGGSGRRFPGPAGGRTHAGVAEHVGGGRRRLYLPHPFYPYRPPPTTFTSPQHRLVRHKGRRIGWKTRYLETKLWRGKAGTYDGKAGNSGRL